MQDGRRTDPPTWIVILWYYLLPLQTGHIQEFNIRVEASPSWCYFFFVFHASSNSDILFGFSWNSTFVSVLDMCIFRCYYYRKRIVIVQEHNNSVWGEFQAWAVAFSRFFPLVIGSSWGYDSKYLIIIINYLWCTWNEFEIDHLLLRHLDERHLGNIGSWSWWNAPLNCNEHFIWFAVLWRYGWANQSIPSSIALDCQ